MEVLNEQASISSAERRSSASSAASGSVAWPRWVRLASILVILASAVIMLRSLPSGRIIALATSWVEQLGWWGPLAFAGIYAVATVLVLPGAALTLAAGAVFGLVAGTIAVSIGATLGAAMCFLIARYLARATIERKLGRYPRFRAVDRAVSQGGWKIVALLRLSPAVPFNLQNYLYGLTAIRFWPCILASWLAMLPGTFMYVYLGYAGRAGVAAAAGQSGRSIGQWLLLGVGLLATIVVTVYVTKLARRAIADQAESVEADPPADANKSTSNVDAGATGRTIGLAVSAVVLAVLAGCAQMNQRWLAALFGPPAVKTKEAYAPNPEGATFDHSAFDRLLRRHVNKSGGVDYAALMHEREALRRYIQQLRDAPFEKLTRDDKLALLINAYNAFTLELILDHYNDGELKSIKEIAANRRWDDVRWQVAGGTFSLNQIEHELIRPNFAEPRIHFALVCAAVGCPPLRAEAYTGQRLEQQLAEQTRYVHSHDKWFQYDPDQGVLKLTQLYNWYGGDFEQAAGSVLAYVARFDSRLRQAIERGDRPSIQWLDYDWSLNSQENVP